MLEEQTFIIKDDSGQDVTCRVVFNFESEEHSYVLFAMEGDESGKVSALRYELDENGEIGKLSDLETEEEWAMVEEVLNTLVDQFSEDQANYFTITDENDEESLCYIVHRYEHEGKHYLFYAIVEQENPAEELFASGYVPGENGEVVDLFPLETESEWEKAEAVLETLGEQS